MSYGLPAHKTLFYVTIQPLVPTKFSKPVLYISTEDALMTTDMMSTGFHAVENAEIKYGDNVVFIGTGPVVLWLLQALALT